MIEFLKRLLWEENYLTQKVRATIGIVGMLVISGVLTVPAIPNDTVWGWYTTKLIGVALSGCAWWVRSGDKTPPTVQAMAQANPVRMREMLDELEVPRSTSVNAVNKSLADQVRKPPPVA